MPQGATRRHQAPMCQRNPQALQHRVGQEPMCREGDRLQPQGAARRPQTKPPSQWSQAVCPQQSAAPGRREGKKQGPQSAAAHTGAQRRPQVPQAVYPQLGEDLRGREDEEERPQAVAPQRQAQRCLPASRRPNRQVQELDMLHQVRSWGQADPRREPQGAARHSQAECPLAAVPFS